MNSSALPGNEPCCRVESVVTVDERGQMVLPRKSASGGHKGRRQAGAGELGAGRRRGVPGAYESR